MQFNLPQRWYGAKTNLETERLFALTGGSPKLHARLVSLRSWNRSQLARSRTSDSSNTQIDTTQKARVLDAYLSFC
jgi:hypothetical protein